MYDKCPACNSKNSVEFPKHSLFIHKCLDCGAVYGEGITLGDSYSIVRPVLQVEVPGRPSLYFDFTCLGSEGLVRRHGWFDPFTNCMVQIG